VSKSQLRKTAYDYIKGQLNKLHGHHYDGDPSIIVTLDELILLKEGQADPSTELVASLKQLFQGISTEAEIDARLVLPFKRRQQGKIYKIEGRSHL
jgi:hypothetical protein